MGECIGVDDAFAGADGGFVERADTFTRLFGRLYLYLHPRRDAHSFAPSREGLALLRHLARTGPITISECAKHFERSQAATSERVDRLIQRGWLARTRDENDRRRHLVWLTERGREGLTDHSQPLDRRRVAQVLSKLEEHEQLVLVEGLARLVEAATAHAAEFRGDSPRDEQQQEEP